MERQPLKRDVTRLRKVHRTRVERDGMADTAPPFEAAALSEAVRHKAVQGFTQLLDTEHESVVIAGWMCAGLQRIGAPLDVVGAFGKVLEDEIRHVDLMAQILEGFGVEPSVPVAPLPPKTEMISGAAAIEEVLAGLASFFCVGEELSAHIFNASLQFAKEPRMYWLTSEIFRDEATHGAFGFETAGELVRLLDEDARMRVSLRLEDAISAFHRRISGNVRHAFDADDRELARLGLLPHEALMKIFDTQVEQSVRPRLEAIGLCHYSPNRRR